MVPKFFHLSVARDGVVSLWDTRQKAQVAGESYVFFALTPGQVARLEAAAREATVDNGANQDRG